MLGWLCRTGSRAGEPVEYLELRASSALYEAMMSWETDGKRKTKLGKILSYETSI
jgi:hypothetical protein